MQMKKFKEILKGALHVNGINIQILREMVKKHFPQLKSFYSYVYVILNRNVTRTPFKFLHDLAMVLDIDINILIEKFNNPDDDLYQLLSKKIREFLNKYKDQK